MTATLDEALAEPFGKLPAAGEWSAAYARLTDRQKLNMQYLSPSYWPEPFRTWHYELQFQNEGRRREWEAAHQHDFDYAARVCVSCGTSEIAHEAAKIDDPLGALCNRHGKWVEPGSALAASPIPERSKG